MSNRKVIGIQRGEDFPERWAMAVSSVGAEVRWLDLLDSHSLRQVEGCDGVMWHWAHYPHELRMAALPILRVMEKHLHIPTYPNMSTCWHYDDKIAQSYFLKVLVAWMVESCPGHWDSKLQWHEGHVWPEEAHVEDFLRYVGRSQSVDS
jgi:hypothetical protein